jgi:hypothetical protein
MPYISKKLFQVFKKDSMQISTQRSRIPCLCLDGPVMHPDAQQCREASNSSRLHPFGHHGNTSGCSSEFEKIPTFLCRHGVGRQLAPVWMLGQHHLDTEILDKEIACIHSASVQTTGQHRPDAALIWKRMERIMESRLHRRLPERSMLPFVRNLKKSKTDLI